MNVPTRVVSVCNARTKRSIIILTCSSRRAGMPAGGRTSSGFVGGIHSRAGGLRVLSICFSTLRTLDRYSSILCPSFLLARLFSRLASARTRSTTLCNSRASSSAFSPVRKSRSKATCGLISGEIREFGDAQETVFA